VLTLVACSRPDECELYACGDNSYGQLGLSRGTDTAVTPEPVAATPAPAPKLRPQTPTRTPARPASAVTESPAIRRILATIEARPQRNRKMWHSLQSARSNSPTAAPTLITEVHGFDLPYAVASPDVGAADTPEKPAPVAHARTTGRYEDLTRLPNGATAMLLPCPIARLDQTSVSLGKPGESVREFCAGGYHSVVVTGT
jgi:hypothetical protein